MTTQPSLTLDQMARLSLSYDAREFSDSAHSAVSRTSDSYQEPAGFSRYASSIRYEALSVVSYAVISERRRGTDWEVIAKAVDRPLDEVKATFSSAESDFLTGVLFPVRHAMNGGLAWQATPLGISEPVEKALELDQWITGGPQDRFQGNFRNEHFAVSSGFKLSRDAGLTAVRLASDAGHAIFMRRFPAGVDYDQLHKGLERLQAAANKEMVVPFRDRDGVTPSVTDGALSYQALCSAASELRTACRQLLEAAKDAPINRDMRTALNELAESIQDESTSSSMIYAAIKVSSITPSFDTLPPRLAATVEELRMHLYLSPAAVAGRMSELKTMTSETLAELEAEPHVRSSGPEAAYESRPLFSAEALARLVFSAAAREASDYGRFIAARNDDASLRPGELVAKAARLLAHADVMVTRAVVADRLAGNSWDDITDGLRLDPEKREVVEARYTPAVTNFETAVWLRALTPPDGNIGELADFKIPKEVLDPLGQARLLDKWYLGGYEQSKYPLAIDDDKPAVSTVLSDATLDELAAEMAERLAILQRRIRLADLPEGVRMEEAEASLSVAEDELCELVQLRNSADPAQVEMLVEGRNRIQGDRAWSTGRGPRSRTQDDGNALGLG